jgi:CheY-like chemotaxis protein
MSRKLCEEAEMAETVLVVEDDRANAILIETLLTSLGGFEVISSDDGDDVLATVAAGGLAAVVMDVSLRDTRVGNEKVDGVDLTRRIRALAAGAHLPVILLTAHAMRGDREHLLFSSGANDYVAKPITDQRAFVELVGRHIRSSGSVNSIPGAASIKDDRHQSG